MDIEVRSEIPLRGGLGSSAAATIAGLRLRELVDGRRSGDEILAAASKIEGHRTTSAPSLFGGVTSCCAAADGTIRVTKWPWPKRWRIVVATPGPSLRRPCRDRPCRGRCRSPTPSSTCSTWRCCSARCGLGTRRISGRRFAIGCISRIAQRLVPGLRRLLSVRHPDVIGFCLSGAGPSIAAFADGATAAGRTDFETGVPAGADRLHGEDSESAFGR